MSNKNKDKDGKNLHLSNKQFKAMIKDGERDSGYNSVDGSMGSDDDDEMVKVLELVINSEECMIFCHESMMEGRKLDFINVLKAAGPVIAAFRTQKLQIDNLSDNK